MEKPKYIEKREQKNGIVLENAIQFNDELYQEINEKTKYHPLTIELMKITINRLIDSMHTNRNANKKLFYMECLNLI